MSEPSHPVICHANDLGIRPLVRASRSRSSRKSGWASEIIAFARSGTDLPLRLTSPYSVTANIVSLRGAVTILPGVKFKTMRLRRTPARSYVDDMQMNDFPPFDA